MYTGDYRMDKNRLKEMIKQVIMEGRKNSVLLESPYTLDEDRESKYEKLMKIMTGKDPSVGTIGIMSGQNPMAKSTTPEYNEYLKDELEKAVDDMGLPALRVGGLFEGLAEKSLMILNPSMNQMEELNRAFTQWGFVFGDKWNKKDPDSFMIFKLFEVDYDSPTGQGAAQRGRATGTVLGYQQLKNVADDVSIEPTSGKKFGVQFFEE
jgi:hypothetical protein